LIGCALLGVSPAGFSDIDWHELHRGSYREMAAGLIEAIRPYFWPYCLGNMLLGMFTAAVAYVGLRFFLERRRSKPTAAPAGS
jgi:hypothetical protein